MDTRTSALVLGCALGGAIAQILGADVPLILSAPLGLIGGYLLGIRKARSEFHGILAELPSYCDRVAGKAIGKEFVR